jgi:hypothetical protein
MPDWWIGRTHSEETKQKMRLAKLGANNNFFGKTHTEETKTKMSEIKTIQNAGENNPMFGRQHHQESKDKISKTRKERGHSQGPLNPVWKGGVCEKTRQSKRELRRELNRWRKEVLERADYKCEACDSDERLSAHHIKDWQGHPKLRFRVSNGQCLCHSCHSKETVKEAKSWQSKFRKE